MLKNLKHALLELKKRYPTVKVEIEVDESFFIWYVYNIPFAMDKGKKMKKKEGHIFRFPIEMWTNEELVLKLINRMLDDRTK